MHSSLLPVVTPTQQDRSHPAHEPAQPRKILRSTEMRSGSFQIPPMERVFFGRPFDQAIEEEVERLNAKRIFLLLSNTLNRKTKEIEKVRARLGDKIVGEFDEMPAHIPRD